MFLNEYPLNNNKKITIQSQRKDFILGLPSGEVIYLSKDNIKKLKLVGLVRDEYNHHYNDIVSVFKDSSYEDIIYILDYDDDNQISDEEIIKDLFNGKKN